MRSGRGRPSGSRPWRNFAGRPARAARGLQPAPANFLSSELRRRCTGPAAARAADLRSGWGGEQADPPPLVDVALGEQENLTQ